ncbi:MAG TPA: DJ-1/PfpI family protein [Phycisphaerales bacterium]|nr:DJ-1/PfpI family protein [Phycisphaerales bacterium]HMP38034.1 DJ-1/PfpI family protein [Phycisphaerales bacterium]
MKKPLVFVLLFPDVELLDFAGPLEVFSVARDGEGERLFDVVAVAPPRPRSIGATTGVGAIAAADQLRARHGLAIAAEMTVDDAAPGGAAPAFLVVPGGYGIRALLEDVALLEFLRRCHASGTTVASVCTGAWLLARAGLLEGREATTHHLCLERLKELAPSCVIRPDRRVIDCGSVITSGGISAGIDMALHLVATRFGHDRAVAAAEYMEYRWDGRA